MSSIPDDVLDQITTHRPHLAGIVVNLRLNPTLARSLEKALADAYPAGETRLSAADTFRLAACSDGWPFGSLPVDAIGN